MGKNKGNQKEKKSEGFGREVEKYTYLRLSFLGRIWKLIAIVVVGLILGVSLAAGYLDASPLFGSLAEVVKYSANKGDYETAQKLLYSDSGDEVVVLGRESEIEEVVNPEMAIQERLAENSRMIEKYPNNKELLERQAKLLETVGDFESAQIFLEQARVLDPNNIQGL